MILLLTGLGILATTVPKDVRPGLAHGRLRSQDFHCERATLQQARVRYPRQIRPEKPRGDYIKRDAVLCQERLLRRGLRTQRDEAILGTLQDRSAELATAVQSNRPDLAGRTFLVEAFYPDAQVSGKIGFATKNALMRQGLGVSDRTPVLSAGDVDVLTRMPAAEAYPSACRRWHDRGAMSNEHALVAVVSRDPRETALHAGLCADGNWTWLR